MRRSSYAVAAMRSSAGGVASLDELSHLSLSARFLIGKFRASLLVAFKLMLCEVIGGVFIILSSQHSKFCCLLHAAVNRSAVVDIFRRRAW